MRMPSNFHPPNPKDEGPSPHETYWNVKRPLYLSHAHGPGSKPSQVSWRTETKAMSNWECCPQTRTYLTKSSTFILVYPGGVHNFFLSEPSFLAAASKTSFYRCQINPAGEVSSEHFNPTMKKSSKSLGFRWIVPILPPRFCWSKFPDSSLINQLKSSITYKPQFLFPRVDLHCHGTGRLRQTRCPALLALCTGHATCSGIGGCRTQQGLGEAIATRSL